MSLESDKQISPTSHLSDGLTGQARTAFIVKVYTLLTSTSIAIQWSWE
jgi:hypothetical protein